MGVIYKLKREIKDYIREEKKNKPTLSCRNLVSLIESRFQIKVSKSSINAVIKESGLSLPVGRRPKKRRRKAQIPLALPQQIENKQVEPPLLEAQKRERIEHLPEPVSERLAEAVIETEALEELPPEIESTGAILLKAADYLIAGSARINEVIREHLNLKENDLLTRTESLIYMSLFNLTDEKELSRLWGIVGKKIPLEDLIRYLNKLQAASDLPPIISRLIWQLFQGVRSLKVVLTEGSYFYLDGQLHTLWSTPQIPHSCSTTLYNITSYIDGCFDKYRPFVLLSGPGYDTPAKELFDFIISLEGQEKGIAKLILYSPNLEEIRMVYPSSQKKYFFIFGLWPWQFGQYRRVKLTGERRQFSFAPLKKDFYLIKAEVELTQPVTNTRVTLKGCALKTNPDDKIKLIILTNLPQAEEIEELAHLYLSRWPNLEEGFQDFSRKIELFIYTALSRQTFAAPQHYLGPDAVDIKKALANYLNTLDAYVRWHFLPCEYKESDFSTVNAWFYCLKTRRKEENGHIGVAFQPPADYPYLRELAYACRRVNEREILTPEGKRLWLDHG